MMTQEQREAMIIGIVVRYGVRLSIEQAAALLGMSESQLQTRIRERQIEYTKDGTRTFFTPNSLIDYSLQSHTSLRS
jgi:hypothetical protein